MMSIGPIVDAVNLLQQELPRVNYLLNYAEQFRCFQKTQEEMAQNFRSFMESVQLSLNAQRSQNDQILNQQREILAQLSRLENASQARQSLHTLAPTSWGTNDADFIPNTTYARLQEYPSPRSLRMSVAPIDLEAPLASVVMEEDYGQEETYHHPAIDPAHTPSPLSDVETKLYSTPDHSSVTSSQTSYRIDSDGSSSQTTASSSSSTFKPSDSTSASRPQPRHVSGGNTYVSCFTEMQEESRDPRQLPVTRPLIQKSIDSPLSSLSEPQRRVVECIQGLTRTATDGRGVHVNDIILTLKNGDCEWTADSLLDAFDAVENLGFIETLEEDVERYVAL